MTEELFDIYQENGEPAGQASRSRTHRQALWHSSTNIFCFNHNGQLLIQRRQLDKDVCPDAWDLSVAEHLQPGESYQQAAIRGLQEELGIQVYGLEKIGDVIRSQYVDKAHGIFDFEFQQSFRADYSGELFPDPVEVAEVKYISLEELAADFENHPDQYTPWFKRTTRMLGIIPLDIPE